MGSELDHLLTGFLCHTWEVIYKNRIWIIRKFKNTKIVILFSYLSKNVSASSCFIYWFQLTSIETFGSFESKSVTCGHSNAFRHQLCVHDWKIKTNIVICTSKSRLVFVLQKLLPCLLVPAQKLLIASGHFN